MTEKKASLELKCVMSFGSKGTLMPGVYTDPPEQLVAEFEAGSSMVEEVVVASTVKKPATRAPKKKVVGKTADVTTGGAPTPK